MNPFDLPGPTFLIVYWTLSVVVALIVYWQRLQTDAEGAPAATLSDPYALAFLRGGYPEVMRVAVLKLVQEGVVAVDGINFKLAATGEPARRTVKIRRPAVEEALLAHLATQTATIDLIVIASVGRTACEQMRPELEQLGYLRRQPDAARLNTAAFFASMLLAAVGAIKIILGYNRGRPVALLVISTVVASNVVLGLGRRLGALTTRGKQALAGTEALLAGARQRLDDASVALTADELAWLAAAYGFAMFDAAPATFAFWPALAFQSGERDRAGNLVNVPSSSSGSSCSTTMITSSCGSSCGGGGCGGGCGGCGS